MSGAKRNGLQLQESAHILHEVLPMVEIKVVLKASSKNEKGRRSSPLPSPDQEQQKSRSYVFFAIGRSGSGSRRRRPQGIGPSHYGQLLLAPGVLGPEDRGEPWGKRTAREGAGDLGTASSRKPRRWRRPVPPRAATLLRSSPSPSPGSRESVGTKWPPPPSGLLGRDAPTGERAGSAVEGAR